LLKSEKSYDLFELTTNDGSYVYIPQHRPMAVKVKDWKEKTMEWIYTIKALDYPFVLLKNGDERFLPGTAVLSEEDYLGFLSSLSQNPEEIPVWLALGPFSFPAGIPDDRAADMEFINMAELRPEAGGKQFGKTWKPILRKGPIFVDNLYNAKFNFVSYYFVRVHSDRQQRVLLHYSNDDQSRIYLNGERVVNSPFTGLYNYRTQEVTLKQGGNALLYKLEQGVGGAFFHARITGLDGKPLSSISYSITEMPKGFVPERTGVPGSSVKEMEVSDRQIRFKTRALHEPHIIKMSYFPNWKVKGAKHVFHVTPNFMLVYPEQEEVTLYYGSLPVDILGRALTFLGGLMLVVLTFTGRR
jgi:hypothetical protein